MTEQTPQQAEEQTPGTTEKVEESPEATVEQPGAAPDAAAEETPEEATPGESAPEEKPTARPEPAPKARAAAPRPGVPSPAMFAGKKAAAPRPAATAPSASRPAAPAASTAPTAPSDSVRHGRVAEDGTVFVILADGTEREVGSFPDASHEEALAYFARKYDELWSSAALLRARLASADVSTHDARQSLAHLKEQIGQAHVVGDLAALEATVSHLDEAVAEKARADAQARQVAKARAAEEREQIVLEAEKFAATDPAKMQWKPASARVRELLEEWKAHQRSGPRLDKDVENPLWQRFSSARTAFDKTRKAWFAQLDEQHAEAQKIKERLVREAEALSGSTDWGATASAFKRLMQEWKRAGRASRAVDDKLWARFKAAQDGFFNAKDEVVAAEEAEFSENLTIKEDLLVKAEAIEIDEQRLDQAKGELRRVQDQWDAAGKVPRGDIRRVESRLRAVEQQIRDIEDKQWRRADPELTARAQSMVDQLERAVQGLESDLAAARSAGDEKNTARLESELSAKRMWLESARGGLS